MSGFVAPWSDDRSVDDSRSMCQQPLHRGIEVGHLYGNQMCPLILRPASI